MKVAVLSASLGGIDAPVKHVNQTVKADYFHFTDENFPPRDKAMTPRLQAKIPKCFGWQLKPDYDVYLWLDGNISLAHQESLQYFLDALVGWDWVFLQHPDRTSIHWEYRHTWRGLHSNAPSNYMVKRYANEFLDEQYEEIKRRAGKRWPKNDNCLVNGGVFMYRNTPLVQEILKEWWYHISRYLINDQLSLSYLINQNGIASNILPDDYRDSMWLKVGRHSK